MAVAGPVTLADALAGDDNPQPGKWSEGGVVKGGRYGTFDRYRHRGMLNVPFVDAHAATVQIGPPTRAHARACASRVPVRERLPRSAGPAAG